MPAVFPPEGDEPGECVADQRGAGQQPAWSTVTLSVYLRQRGSPESEPAGEPHDSTGVSG